jgi:hypothetical protein
LDKDLRLLSRSKQINKQVKRKCARKTKRL